MMIKNIIFDLGGVILDLHYDKMVIAFEKLGAKNFREVYNLTKQEHIVDDFDIGKINAQQFRQKLMEKLNITLSDLEFDLAWNSMLGLIPLERLEFIKQLREHYKTYLFSNTNDIHLREVFDIFLRQHGKKNLTDYFEKEYYSNQFGQRKPNVAAFLTILKDNHLNAQETLFVDDTLTHILGAKEAGLHTMHLSQDKTLFDVVKVIAELEQSS